MGFQRAWLRKEKLKALKAMVFVTMSLERFMSSRGERMEGKGKMEDFKDEKIEERVVIGMAGMAAGMLAVAEKRVSSHGYWEACSNQDELVLLGQCLPIYRR
ncbi:unnamed protein product [Prunus brigantina]